MNSRNPVVFAFAAALVCATALAAARRKVRIQGAIYKFLDDSRRYLGI